MLRLRRALAMTIVVLVLGVVAWVWFNLPRTAETVLNVLPDDVDVALERLHYTHNENGAALWTLDAENAEYQQEPGLADLAAVELTLYQDNILGEILMTSENGRFAQQQNRVETWGNVQLISERGDNFFTEALQYDVETQVLRSDDPFRYVSDEVEMSGTGLEINLVTGRLLIEKNVWVKYNPQQGLTHE